MQAGEHREHTVSMYRRSSRIRASWISRGTRSSDSCFSFPFAFGGTLMELTRELRGARTKDVSAMKDGSFWTKIWLEVGGCL